MGAFYGQRHMWKRIARTSTKRGMFLNLVVNTLLSGLEAETLRQCDYETLEKCTMGLARKAVSSKSIYWLNGKKQQHSHARVRSILRLTNVFITLRIRGLKWLSNILEHPMENAQLRAALGGPLIVGSKVVREGFTP